MSTPITAGTVTIWMNSNAIPDELIVALATLLPMTVVRSPAARRSRSACGMVRSLSPSRNRVAASTSAHRPNSNRSCP
ncbi:hypothetical protein [Nocardia farcinica]|uniref:hypothetical protein n=1 Tax=Nocardia farcinica TaxID=37329 RepID=UPI0024584791|nr:hypothetical protein [Nocardia farcinica]